MALVADPVLRGIENKLDEGVRLSKEDGLALIQSRDLHTLGRLATKVKLRKSGRKVFYVLNRYINSTNVCYAGCKFCSFAASEKEARAVRMPADEVLERAFETGDNFNQIHIVGGHDPRQLSLDYWLPLMRRFRQRAPHVQLSLFTAAELDYMARRHRLSYEDLLSQLKEAGLDNINGGGAEIFSKRFRDLVCPNKVNTENWLRVHEVAHRVGVASNATMLYGTIETLEERIEHLMALRESQDRSPGFNAFIPLAFHPDGNELNDCGWTSGLDDIRMFATARLMLDNFDHIKAYWMIQGIKVCQVALLFGADDMDGTHGSTDEELIYHSAGTQSGQHVDDREFRRLIEAAGYVPVRRNSTYQEFPLDWKPADGDPGQSQADRGPVPSRSAVTVADAVRRGGDAHALRAGRIVYTNDLPIYAAFDAGAVQFPGHLVTDVPSRLNAMLTASELDLGPISAFHFAKHAEDLVLLPDLCIGSRTEVWSVLLVSREPLAALDGKTIAVTTESASGRSLLRILLERQLGVHAQYVDTDDPLAAALRGRPALLIGDRAIDAQFAFGPSHVYDLGTLWHAWTGLDMVYAVWAVRRAIWESRQPEVRAALAALQSAAQWGEAHPESVVAAAQAAAPRQPGFYSTYFATLNFEFDARARAGLRRYFDELVAIGAISRVPSVEPEVVGVA